MNQGNYAPPPGFTFDPASGLYYKTTFGRDPITGQNGEWDTWFYPDSGQYKQVFTPTSPAPIPDTMAVAAPESAATGGAGRRSRGFPRPLLVIMPVAALIISVGLAFYTAAPGLSDNHGDGIESNGTQSSGVDDTSKPNDDAPGDGTGAGTGSAPTATEDPGAASRPGQSADANERGNSTGNIVNDGLAAIKSDWIYYCNYNGNLDLYKIRTDGTGRQKLCDDYADQINVVGDWVFYRNRGDGNRLYAIRTDGTERQMICDDGVNYLNVVGGWAYYVLDEDRGSSGSGPIYKIRTDGTERQKISDDHATDLNVVGDWLYFSHSYESGIPYKIRTDGAERQQLSAVEQADYPQVAGDWIYYTFYEPGIHKIRTDGTDKQQICDDIVISHNVADDGRIYYSSREDGGVIDDKLYSMGTDGTDKRMICDDNVGYINVVGDWVYYINFSDDGPSELYRIRTDGTDRQPVE